MNQSSQSSPYHSHHSLEMFSTKISNDDIQLITNSLQHTYGDILKLSIGGTLALPPQAYSRPRDQYDGERLLRHLLTVKNQELALWVISPDLYTKGMNFIFGLASYVHGAVLSLHRLHTTDLKGKEAIHEIGHVLGLEHCTHNCVMQYSNSLGEAQRKPLTLCEQCKRKLNI